MIDLDVKYDSIEVSPSAPVFFHFPFPRNSAFDVALLKMTSEDTLCTTLSVQNATCPVFDLDRNVAFEGIYQTVDSKAGVTFTRSAFPNGVFIVFVVKADDEQCLTLPPPPILNDDAAGTEFRTKRVSFLVERKITRDEYLAATLGAVGIFTLCYVVVLSISCMLCFKQMPNVGRNPDESSSLLSQGEYLPAAKVRVNVSQ